MVIWKDGFDKSGRAEGMEDKKVDEKSHGEGGEAGGGDH